jgi:hypothetical protein
MRMWRDAVRLALTVGQRAPDLHRRRRTLDRVADRFFLELLRDDPGRIPPLLSALFARAPGDSVLAFLDEQARFGETLAVARAMPGWLRWMLGFGLR